MASVTGKKRNRPAVTPEDQAMFMAAVGDVTPLGVSNRRTAVKPARLPAREEAPPADAPLVVDDSGQRFCARAPGVSLEQAAVVRSGKIHIEDTIDLHRLTRDEGIARLRTFLVRARQVGRRCVLVIHGRGLHGFGHSVMREAVRAELLGPLSGFVRVVTSATQRDGGDGATYVVIRSPK